jgi:hypothetical protein
MNLMLLPILIMFFFSIFEIIIPNEKKLKEQLYKLAFFIVFFVVAIKYYYGPDIRLYAPLYEKIESPLYILKNGSTVGKGIEIGYIYYCSIFKWLGFSFWFFTFSISCIYFYAIYKYFELLHEYKLFALFVLTIFESNIFFFEFRQAIAVSLFILSILSYFNKKYFRYILLSLLSILFHKSAFFVSSLTFIIFFFPIIKYKRNYYILLIAILITGMFVSIDSILNLLILKLPINPASIFSFLHHIEVKKELQAVLLIYLLCFIGLYLYSNNKVKNNRYYILILSFLAMIAIFYKYWFFLNRVRSYFTPLLIVFVINELTSSKIRLVAIKQLLVIAVYFYGIWYVHDIWLINKNSSTKILSSTTIFDLRKKSEDQIKKENLKKSVVYFNQEYLKKQ